MNEELKESGLFEAVDLFSFQWKRVLTTEDYLKLIHTYSFHRSLSAEKRTLLFDGIRGAINKQGGKIELFFETKLHVGKKVGASAISSE